MNFEDKLNDYQKKRIKERLSLNFETELMLSGKILDRIKFNKNFRNEIDIFVTELFEKGVMFYGFTISMPFLERNDPDLWYYTHLNVESWIEIIKKEIDLVEFCYLSINLSEGVPFFKGIFGVRNFVGKNKYFINEIKKVFNIHEINFSVSYLNTKNKIRNCWYGVIKENNFRFHRFVAYEKFFENLYGSIADLELQYDENNRSAFGIDYNIKNDIEGVNQKKPSWFTILLYLLTLYMKEKNYYINDNQIYKKTKNSHFSWEFFDSIDYFNLNVINIFEFFKKKYSQQMYNFNIVDLVFKHWDFFYTKIKKNNNYLPTIKFKDNVIEFKDGLYFFKQNYFYDFNKNSANLNICCYKYFSESYFFFKKNVPFMWLSFLRKNLKNYEVEDFCFYLGEILNNPFFFGENKEYVCVLDKSKITIIAEMFIMPYKSNTKSKFEFELEEYCEMLLCRDLFYSVCDMNDILSEKKKKERFLFSTKPFSKNEKFSIFFSFKNCLNKKILKDKFIVNKLILNVVSFFFLESDENKYLSFILEKEFLNIMIYCNDLYLANKKALGINLEKFDFK